MTRMPFITLSLALSSAAFATAGAAPTWQEDVASQMAQADPDGGWEVLPVPAATAAAKTKADILIENHRDGSQTTTYHGNITLKRGVVAEMSTDGTQALVYANAVALCDWELGCEVTETVGSCAYPMCGGITGLVDASPAYLVVDVSYNAVGEQRLDVTDLILGYDKIEPEEID